jgi:hypothetical protein
MLFIDKQEIDFRVENHSNDVQVLIGKECFYYHLVTTKSWDAERLGKHGYCGTPAIIADVRGESKQVPFYVDLAFPTEVPDIYLLVENLPVDGLQVQAKEVQPGEIHLVDFTHMKEIIAAVNDAHDPKHDSAYQNFRGKLFQKPD